MSKMSAKKVQSKNETTSEAPTSATGLRAERRARRDAEDILAKTGRATLVAGALAHLARGREQLTSNPAAAKAAIATAEELLSGISQRADNAAGLAAEGEQNLRKALVAAARLQYIATAPSFDAGSFEEESTALHEAINEAIEGMRSIPGELAHISEVS